MASCSFLLLQNKLHMSGLKQHPSIIAQLHLSEVWEWCAASFFRVSQGEIWVSGTLHAFLEVLGKNLLLCSFRLLEEVSSWWMLVKIRDCSQLQQGTLRSLPYGPSLFKVSDLHSSWYWISLSVPVSLPSAMTQSYTVSSPKGLVYSITICHITIETKKWLSYNSHSFHPHPGTGDYTRHIH